MHTYSYAIKEEIGLEVYKVLLTQGIRTLVM